MRALVLPLMAAAVVLLAACGEEDRVTRVKGPYVRLELDDFRIRPQRVRVDAGLVIITAHNSGKLSHNVRLRRNRLRGTARRGTATIQPGQTTSAPLRLKPGDYTMLCTIANHDDLGQYGTLIVR